MVWKLSVFIDNTEIEKHYIEIFEGFLGGELLLSGKALEEEGKKIYDKLSDYKIGDVVQIKDFFKGKYSGVYEIKHIELSTEVPAIYVFKIGLKRR